MRRRAKGNASFFCGPSRQAAPAPAQQIAGDVRKIKNNYDKDDDCKDCSGGASFYDMVEDVQF